MLQVRNTFATPKLSPEPWQDVIVRASPGRWLQIGSLAGFGWTQIELRIDPLPDELCGLRIMHLTDLHLTHRWRRGTDDLIKRLHDAPPDLICITGDFVDDILDHRAALPTLERFIKALPARVGIFGITGNHDGDLLGPRLEALGVRFVNQRLVRLASANAALEVIGLPGIRRRAFDVDWMDSLPSKEPGVPRIVLGHFPDQIRAIEPLQADLMFAGHTHGGQICLPSGMALLTHDALPKQFASGVHRVGVTQLVVGRGFGWTRWPIRIFCPAEVVEITLQAAR